jgi:hypothetical protein
LALEGIDKRLFHGETVVIGDFSKLRLDFLNGGKDFGDIFGDFLSVIWNLDIGRL